MGTTPNFNLPYPEPSDVPDVPGRMKDLAEAIDGAQLLPVGAVVAFAGTHTAVNAMDEWLVCDGNSFSGTSYPLLQSVLGGTTTPNLQDRFIKGSATRPTTKTGGTDSISVSHLPPHNHPVTINNGNAQHSHTLSINSNGDHFHELTLTTLLDRTAPGSQPGTVNPGGTGTEKTRLDGNHSHTGTAVSTNATHNHTGSTSATGGGQDFEPKHYIMLYIIKAK